MTIVLRDSAPDKFIQTGRSKQLEAVVNYTLQ